MAFCALFLLFSPSLTMAVVFFSDCHVLFLMMIGLPQLSGDEFTILAVHDRITEKWANPAFNAAHHYVFDLYHFSLQFTHVIVNEDINSTLESIYNQWSELSSLGKQIVGIIDTTMSGITLSLQNLFKNLINVPIVFNAVKDNYKKNINILHILPPNRILMSKLRDFIASKHSTSIIVIIQEDLENEMWTNSTLYQLPMNETAIKNKLRAIQSCNESSVLVVGNYHFINSTLELACALNVFMKSSILYTFSKEEISHLQLARNCSNPIVILEAKKYNETRLTELSIKYTSLSRDSQVDAFFYFDIGLATLLACSNFIYSSKKFNHELLELIKKEITLLSPPFGLFYFENDRIQQNFTIGIKKRLDYKNKTDTFSRIKREMSEKSQVSARHKLTTIYKVAVVEFPPFIFRQNSSKKQYYGYCIDLIEKLSEKLSFNYTLIESEFGLLPDIRQNYSWSGVIKDLIEKRIDIALAPMSIMQERMKVIDFTIPFHDPVGIAILMRRPKIKSPFFLFITVLEADVWGYTFLAYLATSLILSLYERFNSYNQNSKQKYVNDDHQEFNLKESLWFCIISLTPLGSSETPKSLSAKVMVISWWIFGFIMLCLYMANLAAYITVSRSIKSIKGLDDLFSQHKIKYAPVNGSTTMVFFERMAYIEQKIHKYWTSYPFNNELNDDERARIAVWEYPLSDKYINMWKIMKKAKLPQTLDEGLKRVLNEDFALIAEGSEVKFSTLINCNYVMVGDEFSRKPYALAIQKGSPLKRELSRGILQLQSERVLEDLKEKWWHSDKYKKCDQVLQHSGNNIENYGGVFCIILFGLGLAGLSLLFEYCWYRDRRVIRHPVRLTNVTPLTRIKYRSPSIRRKPQTNSTYTYYYKY